MSAKDNELLFSVICVFNDANSLRSNLLMSLKSQKQSLFEPILLDNTEGIFKSAASALNYGAKVAKGKYLMFVHQDVVLEFDLKDAARFLNNVANLGVAGVVGMREEGRNNKERGVGVIKQGGEVWPWANPITEPQRVQTLDECLLIIPKKVFFWFDEIHFDGWHLYGVDYCLRCIRLGFGVYVLPLSINHRTRFSSLFSSDLLRYQEKLYKKHKDQFKQIYTTCGELSSIKLMGRKIAILVNQYVFDVFPNIPLKQRIKNRIAMYL